MQRARHRQPLVGPKLGCLGCTLRERWQGAPHRGLWGLLLWRRLRLCLGSCLCLGLPRHCCRSCCSDGAGASARCWGWGSPLLQALPLGAALPCFCFVLLLLNLLLLLVLLLLCLLLWLLHVVASPFVPLLLPRLLLNLAHLLLLLLISLLLLLLLLLLQPPRLLLLLLHLLLLLLLVVLVEVVVLVVVLRLLCAPSSSCPCWPAIRKLVPPHLKLHIINAAVYAAQPIIPLCPMPVALAMPMLMVLTMRVSMVLQHCRLLGVDWQACREEAGRRKTGSRSQAGEARRLLNKSWDEPSGHGHICLPHPPASSRCLHMCCALASAWSAWGRGTLMPCSTCWGWGGHREAAFQKAMLSQPMWSDEPC